jgi:prevent-host-death family protein
MKSVAVSDMRANLSDVLKEIEQGSTIDITSRGKVIAKLVPPDYNRDKVRAKLKQIGKKAVLGDLISPIDVKWETLK